MRHPSRSAKKLSFTIEAEGIHEVIQVHAQHPSRAHQLFGQNLALTRLNSRERLAILET